MSINEWYKEQFFNNFELVDLCEFEFPSLEIANDVAEHLAKEIPNKQFFILKSEDYDWYSIDFFDIEEYENLNECQYLIDRICRIYHCKLAKKL